MDLAQTLETASKDAQMKATEQVPSGSSNVHKVMSPPQNSKEACYRCGLTNHKPNDCRFKEAMCHSCGKKGHIKRACKSSRQPQRRGRNAPTPRGRERTKWVNKDQSDEDSDGSVEVHMVGKSTKPIRVEVRINSKPLSVEWTQVPRFIDVIQEAPISVTKDQNKQDFGGPEDIHVRDHASKGRGTGECNL